MAHEVETLAYVGETPWHQLGTRLEKIETVKDGIKYAGLDWNVDLVPLQTADTQAEVPAFATRRSTDSKILGVVGPTYQPLQNSVAFEFFEKWLESGLVTLDCAGSLRGGSRIFVLAKIAEKTLEVVPGDPVEQYILLANGHDGTMATRAGFTPNRVVCMNTLQMALSNNASKLIRVRHTGGAHEALAQIRDIMELAHQEFVATIDQYRALSRHQISASDLEKYIRVVFKLRNEVSDQETEEVEAEDEGTGSGKRIVANVVPLFEHGRGNDIKGVKGSFWAAYNAVTEYTQYYRGNDDARRLDQNWFGTGATINQRALQTAIKMVAA